jgi:SAM-dependent methyltransferase
VPDWEERITRGTKPSIRVEHDLRYRLAAPIVRECRVWADLGCGSGVAAAAALAGGFRGRAVLVDMAPEALEQAVRELAIDDAIGIEADLSTAADVDRVRATLLGDPPDGDRVITCFETLEHLGNFVPVVELLSELAEDHAFTVLVSVPNDAFWSIQNPYHRTMWGEGAFEELCRLLPDSLVVLHQVPLAGSAVVVQRSESAALPVPDVDVEADRVPSHFLAAFGPRAAEAAPRALVQAADVEDQRRWERQRENDLAVLQARSESWAETRAYCDELEERLAAANNRITALESGRAYGEL